MPDRVPARGEKLEHQGILIEWDYPKPVNPVVWKPNHDNWLKRLNPLKNTPGRRARVLRDLKESTVRSRATRIRKSLRIRDPKSNWKIETGKEDNGTYSLWVTYNGVYSETEYEEAQAKYAYYSRRGKLARAQAERKKQLTRSSMNPSLKPPVVTMADLEEKAQRIARSRS